MTDSPKTKVLTYRDRTWGERPASFDINDIYGLYGSSERFGHEEVGARIELFSDGADGDQMPLHVVIFDTTCRLMIVELDRDQDLIDLLALLAPIVTMSRLDELREKLDEWSR